MKMKKCLYFFISAILLSQNLASQKLNEAPVETIKRIGDKLIRETPFAYRLILSPTNNTFNSLKQIDFGRTFGLKKQAVAYAYTQLSSLRDTIMHVELDHNDACKVWCNGILIYDKKGIRLAKLSREERGVELPFGFDLKLKKGNNDLLIKSETAGEEWCVFIQPPSEKDAVLSTQIEYPEIGLRHIQRIDNKISELTNWLVVGPFQAGIDISHEPEQEMKFGYMYKGADALVTWTIPKTEIFGDVISSNSWGSTYQWNYHNGGVAWAMQQLTEVTKEEKYNQWATNFCDYHMEGLPFVNYQVNDLKAVNSANSMVVNSSLLDFTLAPSLPLIYRLRKEAEFPDRDLYKTYVEKMMHYARFDQIRSAGMTNYNRKTPEEYTVWADDMFMGIPFLIQAGLYAGTPELRKIYFDDAANQILDFSKHVWDKDAQLYMHANYTSHPKVKLPHWSRANGWAIWAMSEVLMSLPSNHPKYLAILNQYKTLVNSIIRYQDESGFWHNVIDRKDSPNEVSGTAIFNMAIARGITHGWLDRKKYLPIVFKSWRAIASEVEADGTVHNICIGTMCSEDVNYYINRPFVDNDTHGSFAVLFAGIEMQRMLNKYQSKK